MTTKLVDGKSKKQKQLSDMMKYMLCNLTGTAIKNEDEELIRTVSRAKQEMLDAESYFDSVTAPELIDHAIYKMEAAKSQYVYLLRLAKAKGLQVTIKYVGE